MLTRESFRWRDRNGKVYTLDEINAGYLGNIINYLEKKQVALEIIDEMWYYRCSEDDDIHDTIYQQRGMENTIIFLRKELKHRRRDAWTLE